MPERTVKTGLEYSSKETYTKTGLCTVVEGISSSGCEDLANGCQIRGSVYDSFVLAIPKLQLYALKRQIDHLHICN